MIYPDFLPRKNLALMQDLYLPLIQVGRGFHHGRIVKQGNKFLRWALTEAAQTSIRCSEYFRYHYSRIRSRKNANSATIAIARRMLEVIYVMLKENREYIEKPVDIK